ncbi:MAG: DEAD/DEAH box helicase family protein, partial [Actinomycetes bacterium]
MDQLRAGLAKRYAAYVLQYGPINRFTERRGVPDENGDVSISRTGAPAVRRLRTDPHFARVTALELFKPQTQVAKPAGVLSERQITVRRPPMGADTADDALNICMDTIGAVDLPQIARLLGVSEPEARVALGQMVFHDPAQDKLVLAAEYLSGNVRVKLTQAREAALTDPTLAVNVAALVQAQPADLGPGEIEARLGAVWISPDMHRAFLAEILGDRSVTVANPTGNTWFVEGNRWSVAATSEWGTDRRHALDLVTACMEQREIKVLDPDPVIEGRRILNPEATIAAQDKAQALQARFAEWVWEDPARAEVLAAEYNARFNSLVPRDYASAGATLTLPGLSRSFTPYPHQRSAVARILAEPAAGLFHEVGAGKTAEVCMAVMETKRLGKATKPVVVVPNHMLEQFAREWLQLYPQADLLAASSDDLSKDNRRQFVAKVAMNDWDAVVMTRGAFKRIEVSPEAQKRYEQRAVVALRADLEAARASGTPSTVKKMERKLLAAEQNLKRKLDSVKDPGITFEETGIDMIVVDELHDFKNLKTLSAMQGMNTDGSQMAQDLHMKVELLRERHPGRSVFVGATATPIANSIAEAHVMMRYMRPDLLAACGTLNFDSWAATFGKQVTEVEMDPTGAGLRQKTRLAQFTNVPEMMQIWGVFGDVKTAADLQLNVPKLHVHPDTGVRAPVTVAVPRSAELAGYIAAIGERAERIARRAVRPDEDNMLKVSTDGRHAALDMRLVGDRTPIRDGSPAKADVVAEQIARIWAANSGRIFDDAVTGGQHPTPGGLQLVFCDLSTPKNDDSWNVYDELRDQLVAYGIPPDQIRAIHQAKNDTAKAQMFADAREGRIAVLMGSTQKMGVGTNIQARAVALHHVDCPWRPADIAQRDGRIIRQGNQNPEVGIYRYVTTGSFDAYMWQTVERKSKFIAQVLAGRPNARAVDDLTSGDTLSAGEAKALASGNPLMADKVAADGELARLVALSTSYARNGRQLDWRIGCASADIAAAEADLPTIAAAAAASHSTAGDAFAMTVGGRAVGSRAEAAAELRGWAQTHVHRYIYEERDLGTVVGLGGVRFTA